MFSQPNFFLQESYNVTTDIQSRKDKTEKSFEILSPKLWKTMKKIQQLNAKSGKKPLQNLISKCCVWKYIGLF